MTRCPGATLLATVLYAVCLAGPALAQGTGPIGGQPGVHSGTGPIGGQSLSETELEKALRDLDPGLRVRALISPDRKLLGTMYALSVRVGNETHRVLIHTALGQNTIRFTVPLTRQLASLAMPPGLETQVQELKGRLVACRLEWHQHGDGNQTLLARLLGNRPASARGLQNQLNQLLREVEQGRPVWGTLR
jgi:hypothetical protein